jgi:hypothetical protein
MAIGNALNTKKQRNTGRIFVTTPDTKMAFGRPEEDNIEVILEKLKVRMETVPIRRDWGPGRGRRWTDSGILISRLFCSRFNN